MAKAIDTIDCTTFTSTNEVLPAQLAGVKVFPNPFQDSFTVEFTTESGGWIELELMDMLGRRVGKMKEFIGSAGTHQLQWDLPLPAAASQQMLFGLITIQDDKGWARGTVKLTRM